MDRYYPIRTRMLWVGIVQAVVSIGALLGVAQYNLDTWSQVAVIVLNILVMLGVLAGGTVNSENNTTPVSDRGVPLNPAYALVGNPEAVQDKDDPTDPRRI